MPVPCRRKDDISSLHGDSFTVDSGEATLALDDEAHCKRSVSVGLCCLIRHHELKPGVQCISRIWGIFVFVSVGLVIE